MRMDALVTTARRANQVVGRHRRPRSTGKSDHGTVPVNEQASGGAKPTLALADACWGIHDGYRTTRTRRLDQL